MKIANYFKCFKDKNIIFFVLLVVLYNGVVAVLNIFMNTFLLNILGRTEVLLYNMILALVQPVAMLTSLFVCRKIGYLNTQRLGFAFYAIVFILLFVFGEKISNLYYLFCIFIGFGAGYFFTVYSLQMLKYANDGNRDIIQGVTTFFASIISICLPLISGIIIKYTGDELGYKIVFGIVAILAILAILVSFKVKKLGKKEARSNFLKVFSTVMKDRNGRKIMLANAIDNGRTFTLLFFIPVF